MLTYQTTRAVKCVYFDGESATLSGTGQLDSQMLHIYGNTTGPPPRPDRMGLWYEYARAIGLCDWLKEKGLGGPGWGYEGIVRMNAGFEMIWCNFTSPSLRLISHLNVTTPLLPLEQDKSQGDAMRDAEKTSYFPLPPIPTRTDKSIDPSDPPLPPNWRQYAAREPFLKSQSWNWFLSGASHYGPTGAGAGQGELRVKILSCGFLSYYSAKFSIQALARAEDEQMYLNLTKDGLWKGPGNDGTRYVGLTALTRRRRVHTLEYVNELDASVMREDSERALLDLLHQPSTCSGMDWTGLANEIVRTYSGSLSDFLKLIQRSDKISMSNQTALRKWMDSIRDNSHTFLVPFLQYPNETLNETVLETSALFQETYSRCRFHYTRLLDPDEGFSLSTEELGLKLAVEETVGSICNVLVNIGLNVEDMWQRLFSLQPQFVDFESFKMEVERWTEGIEELMAWLGWGSDWTWCEDQCKWDEKCFIPMWPLIPFRGGHPPGPPYNRTKPGYRSPESPEFHGPPPNGTDRSRRRGRWAMFDETDLWKPKCVKSNYISS
jgi:hypothetical protein